ncbi:TonB family protein [Erythrobacter alti]|uniref:TonB family protein n=1 Tax=Erythrobacter alti TaxID=1896145 RepID=UPI0030F39059
MAYLDAGTDPAARAKATATVIGIHALLGFGLVAGLAVTTITFDDDEPITGTIIDIDPPPLPDEPEVVPDTSTPTYIPPQAPNTPFEFDRPIDIDVGPVTDGPRDVIIRIPTPTPGPVASPGPTPTPPPAFTPVGPRPSNNVQSWITASDYSRRDLIRGREGTAQYRLVVGSDGRVDACEITSSTGHASLDSTTCRLLTRNARFNAATDGTGAKVVGTYTGNVTWQIPE